MNLSDIISGGFLDLTSDVPAVTPEDNSRRRFVGIHFTCCDIYSRVYVNREETAYEGRCPRCLRQVTLKIGTGGTSARFFTAG